MENLTIVLALAGATALILITIAGVSISVLSRQKKINALFSRFAQERGGSFTSAKLMKYPAAQFTHHKRLTTIDMVSSGGRNPVVFTRLTTDWPGSELSCYVSTENLFSRLAKMVDLIDIEVGHRPFDEAFVVRGNNEKQICRVFSRKVPTTFLKLAEMFQRSELMVLIDRGRLEIRKLIPHSDDDSLSQFAELALKLTDRLLDRTGGKSSKRTGDQRRAEPAAKPQAKAAPSAKAPAQQPAAASNAEEICHFCDMLIDRDLVLCRSCDAPHHRGCWKCNGGCGDLDCKQRKFNEAPAKV